MRRVRLNLEQAAAAKQRVAVLFGGRSGEHDVSVISGRSVMDALDPQRFAVIPFPISREGRWQEGRILPEPGANPNIDVVFPVLHGTFGEDGTMQGLLELADLPYVGSGVLGSSLCMDKAATKRMCRDAGIAVVDFVSGHSAESHQAIAARAEAAFPYPHFVKPANLGSSVGISKAKDHASLVEAIAKALRYDTTILVERAVDAQEIECSVLGNQVIEASIPGEVVPGKEFYDYEDKYLDGKAQTLIPANITPEQQQAIRSAAIRVAQALHVEGMARVDFFLEKQTGKIFLNEVNTIPGFTSISMYSKMWEATGIPYRDLLTRLIELAVERHKRRRTLSFGR